MKRFENFVNENNIENRNRDKSNTYEKFLKEIEVTMIKDFSMNDEQVRVFIKQYDDLLKSDWEQGFAPKEAIASTKRYGRLENTNESLLNKISGPSEEEIWNYFSGLTPSEILVKSTYRNYLPGVEKALKNNITQKEKDECLIIASSNGFYDIVELLLNNGANQFSSERRCYILAMSNGHRNVVNLLYDNAIKKTHESSENGLEIDIEDKDDEFIEDLVDKLSFVYKKNKDRHVRPINISGKNKTANISLNVILSNKDTLNIKYRNNDDLKISVNGDVLFHMDDIKKDDIIDKTYKIYTKYLTENKFKIKKKDNPFECLTESLLDKLQGPSKEEMWKKFGYDRTFDTPEDFFLDVIKGIKVKEQTKYPDSLFWEKNGEIIFEQNLIKKELWVNYQTVWKIFEKVFGMEYNEIQLFIKGMVEEHLNWKGFTPSPIFLTKLIWWKNI